MYVPSIHGEIVKYGRVDNSSIALPTAPSPQLNVPNPSDGRFSVIFAFTETTATYIYRPECFVIVFRGPLHAISVRSIRRQIAPRKPTRFTAQPVMRRTGAPGTHISRFRRYLPPGESTRFYRHRPGDDGWCTRCDRDVTVD